MSYIFLPEATADRVFRTLSTLNDRAGNDEPALDTCSEMAAPVGELAWRYDHNSREEPDEVKALTEHQTESHRQAVLLHWHDSI